MLVFLLLLVFTLSVLYVFLNKKYAYWKERGVPFSKPMPFFGNVASAITLRGNLADILNKLYEDFKGYSYVGFFNLLHPALLIRDPEIVKDVLVRQFNNFHDNWIETEPEVDPIFASNPFILQGNKWKVVRAQLTPQFTSSKIKLIFPQILTGCKNMVEYIKNQTTTTFDARDLSTRFTGDNVIRCAYGLEGKSFLVAVPDAFKIGEQISSSSKIVQIKQNVAFFLPSIRKLLKCTFFGDPVPKMFKDLILESIKYREEHNIVRNDYLDFIKEVKTKPSTFEIDENYLVSHAFTFFMDGYETSGLALTYALFELSINLDVQNTARKEIRTILEKYNGKLTYEAFQEMQYVENIIFETLRKHPIIKFISRVCTQELKFPSPDADGSGEEVTIQKGTHIFIPVTAIQNDSDYYPNPDKFDPNNFSESAESLRPKCTFLGFGDGPRICLGRKFALAQVKLGLIAILLEFDVKLDSSTILPIVKENIHLFNSPKTTILVKFHPRSDSPFSGC